MKQFLSALAVIALICLPVAGEEVAFSFRGTIHELDGEFSYFTGQTFEIRYSFERTTDDVEPGDRRSGLYLGAIKSGTLTISRGEEYLTWVLKPEESPNFIEVRNLDTEDAYSASASASGPLEGGAIPIAFIVELMDGNATAVDSDALPSALNIESFPHQRIVRFAFIASDQNTYRTVGVITSANTPVPSTTAGR
jgi:hypothetical protein